VQVTAMVDVHAYDVVAGTASRKDMRVQQEMVRYYREVNGGIKIVVEEEPGRGDREIATALCALTRTSTLRCGTAPRPRFSSAPTVTPKRWRTST
jgi:hypothetical protein